MMMMMMLIFKNLKFLYVSKVCRCCLGVFFGEYEGYCMFACLFVCLFVPFIDQTAFMALRIHPFISSLGYFCSFAKTRFPELTWVTAFAV